MRTFSLSAVLFGLAISSIVQGYPAIPSKLNADEILHISHLPRDEKVALAERLLEIRTAYEYEKQQHGSTFSRRQSPSGSFSPANMACPAATSQQGPGLIRPAATKQLSSDEADYLSRHRSARSADWATWISNSAKLDSALPGGASNYTSDTSRLPRLGFGLSGGGLRAMLVGSGTLMGFDGRNQTANERGTGGLLQLADYVAGLSGGSWATGSLAMNDWATTQQLNDELWDLSSNLIVPESGKISFYSSIVAAVAGKRNEGYQTSLTDYFGLSIADKVLNQTLVGNKFSTTWSDMRNRSSFQNASMPFPIIIADEREPGELIISRNTTIFEFTPYEFGSWNPKMSAFIPIEILGSSLDNGTSVLPDNQCVGGYETFPWVVGTSATLFSGLYLQLVTAQDDSLITDALQSIAGAVSDDQNDVTTVPNPFYGYNGDQNENSGYRNLTLVDGGLSNDNVPLWPLVEPARDLDLIIAIDSSADTTNWPNSSALYQTSLRAQDAEYSAYAFPIMPDTNTVINRGLNTRPVFYGCNANVNVSNSGTSYNGTKTPIIVYLPSYPYVYMANTSTYMMEYSAQESQGVLDNSVAVATLGGADSTWATCLGCAALQRGFERSNTPVPDVCSQCFSKWCWDGVTNTTAPSYSYSPAIGTPEFVSSNGTIQQAPASTGGNGSNSDASSAASAPSSGSGSSSSARLSATVATPLLAAVAVGLALL